MSDKFPELPVLLKALDDIQAFDTVVIDVSQQTTITDYMIICSGRASRHVKAIADFIMTHMKARGLPPLHQSGLEVGDWALIDFGYCVVHIMQPDARHFYRLEELWEPKA